MIAVEKRTLELPRFQGGQASVVVEIPECLLILDDHAERPGAGYCAMRVITQKDGDKKIAWNSQSWVGIQEAKNIFDKCVAEGLIPYRVGKNGKATSQVMDKFDPLAEEIIFVPLSLIVGG